MSRWTACVLVAIGIVLVVDWVWWVEFLVVNGMPPFALGPTLGRIAVAAVYLLVAHRRTSRR